MSTMSNLDLSIRDSAGVSAVYELILYLSHPDNCYDETADHGLSCDLVSRLAALLEATGLVVQAEALIRGHDERSRYRGYGPDDHNPQH